MSSATAKLEKNISKNGAAVKKFHEISVSDPRLFVDPVYQREIKNTNLKRILGKGWNEHKVGILLLSLRPDGRLAVVDGQHRLKAAGSEGVQMLECQIISLPGTEQQIQKAEAELYTALNGDRTPNSQCELWKAQSQYDADVIAMNAVLAEFGMAVKHGRNKKAPINLLACPQAIHRINHMGGLGLLRDTMSVITTCWPNDRDARDGKVVQGLAHFLHTNRQTVDSKHVKKALAKVSVVELMQKMSGHQITQQWAPFKALSFAVLEAYNKGLGKTHKLSTEQYLGS